MLYDLIVRNNPNLPRPGYIFRRDEIFMSPSEFKESGIDKSMAYGYVLDKKCIVPIKRSDEAYNWIRSSIICSGMSILDTHGHLPRRSKLRSLYKSIMSGKMKEDLTEAGLYEECNYRVPESSKVPNAWGAVWSNESPTEDDTSFYVDFKGKAYSCIIYINCFIIPFFKVKIL